LIESTDVEHMYMGFVNISVLIFEVNKNQWLILWVVMKFIFKTL
jgi:hypothetical protein